MLGLPMDLNSDGVTSSDDVSGSYTLLPLVVDLAWTGPRGPQTKSMYVFLSEES